MKRKKQIYEMTLLAILTGIIILLGFTPIGYIKTLGIEITFLVIPVIVGSIILGIKGGTFLGLIFGITSFLQCLFGFSSFGVVLLEINPILTAIVCIVPRTLMGFFTGIVYQSLSKIIKKELVSNLATSIIGTLLNTILFMSLLCLCFYQTSYIQEIKTKLGANNMITFIIFFVGINGLVELIVNTIIGSIISKTLLIFNQKQISKRA